MDVNITNSLGLEADASPAMVRRSIAELQNKLAIETAKADDAEAALMEANKETEDLQKTHDNLEEQINKVKAQVEEAAEENRKTEATEMVNSFAAMGKIENKEETIAAWVDLAKGSKEDIEKIKNMLAALPVNKEASKMDVSHTLPGAGGIKNLSQRMHELAKKNGQK